MSVQDILLESNRNLIEGNKIVTNEANILAFN